MRICDRCKKSDKQINIDQFVIWIIRRDLCTDCEKKLGKIFLEFIEEGDK